MLRNIGVSLGTKSNPRPQNTVLNLSSCFHFCLMLPAGAFRFATAAGSVLQQACTAGAGPGLKATAAGVVPE